MKISEVISHLEALKEKHGDLVCVSNETHEIYDGSFISYIESFDVYDDGIKHECIKNGCIMFE
jgi:hypothetical protein